MTTVWITAIVRTLLVINQTSESEFDTERTYRDESAIVIQVEAAAPRQLNPNEEESGVPLDRCCAPDLTCLGDLPPAECSAAGGTWSEGPSCTIIPCTSVCGNGMMEGDEECDDGNQCDFCDGCTNSCLMTGVCSFSSVCTTDLDCRNGMRQDDNACNCAECDQVCHFCLFTCSHFGDTNCSGGGQANLDDILCCLNGFASFASCHNADIAPCGGNSIINLDDILATLGAFSGANPCGCTENSAPGTGLAPLCGSSNP